MQSNVVSSTCLYGRVVIHTTGGVTDMLSPVCTALVCFSSDGSTKNGFRRIDS